MVVHVGKIVVCSVLVIGFIITTANGLAAKVSLKMTIYIAQETFIISFSILYFIQVSFPFYVKSENGTNVIYY